MTEKFRTRTLGPSIAREAELEANAAADAAEKVLLLAQIEAERVRASNAEVVLASKTEYRTVTPSESDAKQLTLAAVPVDPSRVRLFILGGTGQKNGFDFAVSGAQLIWMGYSLETSLSSGDDLLIEY